MSLRVEIARSEPRFREVAEPWNRLARAAGDDPFSSHEWFSSILSSRPCDLFTLLVWEGETLVGAAALHRRLLRVRGIPLRQVCSLNVPDTVHFDVLLGADGGAAAEMIHQALRGPLRPECDAVLLGPCGESSRTSDLARGLRERSRLPWARRTASRVPVLPIEGSWEQYLASRTAAFRKAHRGILNRIDRLGNATVKRYTADPTGEVLRAAMAVSARGWKAKQALDLGGTPETRAFFTSLTKAAGERGWLSIWLLLISGEPVAMEYHLEAGGVAYALRADYDESLRSSSPGSYLNYHIVKSFFDRGLREYNMGPGLNLYKLRWTDVVRSNASITLFQRRLAPLAAYVLDEWLVPGLRRLAAWRSAPRTAGAAQEPRAVEEPRAADEPRGT